MLLVVLHLLVVLLHLGLNVPWRLCRTGVRKGSFQALYLALCFLCLGKASKHVDSRPFQSFQIPRPLLVFDLLLLALLEQVG
jgi:hypothetical protein